MDIPGISFVRHPHEYAEIVCWAADFSSSGLVSRVIGWPDSNDRGWDALGTFPTPAEAARVAALVRAAIRPIRRLMGLPVFRLDHR